MNPLEGLGEYLDRLERRFRLFTWTRGAAAITAAALLLTVAIVALLMMAAFSPSGVVLGRFALFLGIGAAAAVALVIPLFRMNRRRTATEAERLHPGFDQRLLTFTERANTNASDPFLPLLAEDALTIARDAEPSRVVENGTIIRFVSLAAAAASVLVWLMFWGPGVFGYGASVLWGSMPKEQSKPFYSISVQPGSQTIRRKTDLIVAAQLSGFSASKASVFAKYASSAKWEEAPMERQDGGSGFRFMFVGVPEDVDYYVEAGSLRSSTYRIHTVDLPGVKNIVVTYNYPSWTGLQSTTEDPGGDLRAVQGTVAHLEIQTDRPLASAQVIFEDGQPIHLNATENNKTPTTIPIEKDGTYHIAVMDNGEMVRLTDDYFIEARKAGVPQVHITKPGRDAKVSPIEEVTVEVHGEDEYPLQELALHYSVNGGAEKTVSMLKQKGPKQVTGDTLLAMEDYKLVPGDIVSMYATVRDGRTSARTDMFFVQAVPFEYNFSQSQQQGGGGGADQQEQQISEREKEIIAATFNQIKGDTKTKSAAAENGRYLSDVQSKLRDQAQSLANRMKARQLDGSGAAFQQFVKEMEAAVGAMSPASDKLKTLAFNDALTPEQQALQHLLRAESVFRDIQISISRGGGGGGGAAGGARDLANLFDLELDKDKNQYETSQNAAAEQRQQKIDDALKKLQELARRQQELAQQAQNPQQLAEQRYQQEMLRREAEQLRREMEQLQRGDQDQQGQQSGQQGQQQSASNSGQQSGQQSQSGQQRGQQSQQQSGSMARNGMGGRNQQANNEQLQQAIRSIEQAARDMSDSASSRQPGQQSKQGSAQSQSDAQRAAERLKQAEQTLESMRRQQNGSDVNNLANQAEQLASRQQEFEQKMRHTFGQGNGDEQASRQMAQEKQNLLDEYMQLQKGMQQTSRNLAGTQPDVSKQVRDAMSRSEQSEVQSRMEWAEAALKNGMGQYAVMREALTTNSLNQLRDDLKKAEAGAGSQSSDDKQAMATQQALNQAERVRREIQQLAQAQQARAAQRSGSQNGQGNRPGDRQQQGGQQPGNQPGGDQQGGQQQASAQQGGQQPGGQQQGGSQSGGQQQGGRMNGGQPNGGTNQGGARVAGGWNGGNLEGPGTFENRTLDGVDHVNPQSGSAVPTPAQAQVDYDNLIRDLGRLRNDIGNDRDLARQYQQLIERARQLDPSRWATTPQLAEVINSQVLSQIDEVELMLRRKAQANDGAVRGANPRNPPPGYADAVAEYYRKLSKQ